MKLAALQRDVAEQIGPIWLLLTLSGSAAWVVPIHREQVARYKLVFGDEIAHPGSSNT